MNALKLLTAVVLAIAVFANFDSIVQADNAEVEPSGIQPDETCYITWSNPIPKKDYRGEATGQYYFNFTNGCERPVYCWMKVTRGKQVNKYGLTIGPGKTEPIEVGILAYDDICEGMED